MENTKLVSGVFYQLSPKRETFQGRSLGWWIAFIIIVGGALVMLGGLFILAALSISELGIQVVLSTFVITIIMTIFLAVRNAMIQMKRLTVRRGYALFVLMCVIIALVVFPLSTFFLPDDALTLWMATVGGGLTLSTVVLMIRDAYPELRERGTPGIITTGGLIIVFSMVYMTFVAPFITPYPIRARRGSRKRVSSVDTSHLPDVFLRI